MPLSSGFCPGARAVGSVVVIVLAVQELSLSGRDASSSGQVVVLGQQVASPGERVVFVQVLWAVTVFEACL